MALPMAWPMARQMARRMAQLTALPKAAGWEWWMPLLMARPMEWLKARRMELLSEPLMAQQSVRQTVLLMAQLTGRQRAWQTAQ